MIARVRIGAASLLVIGQHRSMITGDSQTTRPLRHALTHARCPVAVIPAEAAEAAVAVGEVDRSGLEAEV